MLRHCDDRMQAAHAAGHRGDVSTGTKDRWLRDRADRRHETAERAHDELRAARYDEWDSW
jgi:hypothetical protein